MTKKIKSPKELKEELKQFAKYYLEGIERYQEQCKHKNITDWIQIHDENMHFNPTGYHIKLCNDCDKTIDIMCDYKDEYGKSFRDLLINRWKHLKIDLSRL